MSGSFRNLALEGAGRILENLNLQNALVADASEAKAAQRHVLSSTRVPKPLHTRKWVWVMTSLKKAGLHAVSLGCSNWPMATSQKETPLR